MFILKSISRVCFILLMTIALLGMAPAPAQAMPEGPSKSAKPSLEQFLNSNGTLNLDTGYHGSLDIGGYAVSLDPVYGPIFAPPLNADDWFPMANGPGENVFAIAVDGSDVYVGGNFAYLNGTSDISYIAKWDGTTWSGLGTPLLLGASSINSIVVSGINVYVGGSFLNMGGDPNADNIAKWNGSTWSALGTTPLNNDVYSIAVSGTDVYVGGQFTNAGGDANADYLARWNGTNWSALGTIPLNQIVYAIAVRGTDIYVGGQFTDVANDYDADYIAKWDGTNWSALGTMPLNGIVNTVAVSGADLYVGGWFTDAGGDANADYIAQWDGAVWSALGTTPLNQAVNIIATRGSEVYAGGLFTDAGGNAGADYIAKWDGTAWSMLGTTSLPDSSFIYTIAISPEKIYVGGYFTNVPGSNVVGNFIGMWNGATWSKLSEPLYDSNYYSSFEIRDMVINGTDVYVGGVFHDLGGNPNAEGIAKWDGTTWSALGTGVNGDVYDILINGTDLYVAGSFTSAGGVANTSRIAKWNGTTWSALGTGLSGQTYTIAISGANLYAGGIFSNAGGDPNADYFAQWNGTNWSSVGGHTFSNTVSKVVSSGSNIYVVGGGSGSISTWDGSSWDIISGWSDMFPYMISDIKMDGTDIYLAGQFNIFADNSYVYGVAKWDGSTWSMLGDPFNAYIATVTISGTDVYAGGWFSDAGGDPNADGIAKWDGTAWSAVGNLADTYGVQTIAINGIDVYIGGSFTSPLDLVAGLLAPDTSPPSVVINQASNQADPTTLSPINFTATFNEAIDPSTFTATDLTLGGIAPGTLSAVISEMAPYNKTTFNIAVQGMTGNGTVTVALDADKVTDLANNGNIASLSVDNSVSFEVVSSVTETPTITETSTQIPTLTKTSTITPTSTQTPNVTGTPTITQTSTQTLTVTQTPTITQTSTQTPTVTQTPTITPTSTSTTTLILKSIAVQDGWVLESSETSNKGGSLNQGATTFRLGDNGTKKQYRNILSFKTGNLPDNAVITGVTLRMRKAAIIGGGNPVTAFNGFMVDIKKGFFGTTMALQNGDFQATASKTYGPFRPTPSSGWYRINLTTGKAYINKLSTNGGLTQIRLRFKLDDNNDAIANYLSLYSGNAGAASRPKLVITYYVP